LDIVSAFWICFRHTDLKFLIKHWLLIFFVDFIIITNDQPIECTITNQKMPADAPTGSSSKQSAKHQKLAGGADKDIPAPLDASAGDTRQRQFAPRGVPIRRKVELEKYGYLRGCPGCDAARDGKQAAQHSPACRDRIIAAMNDDPSDMERVLDAEIRKASFEYEGSADSKAPRKKVLVQAPGSKEPFSSSHSQPTFFVCASW
jgi:hypothetical protein